MGRAGQNHPHSVSESAVLPQRVVVRLLAVLATAAGCLDAVCVTRLGGPFASVITGNLVQVGVGTVTLNGRLAVAATTAVAGYAVGAAAGGAGLGHQIPGWHRRTSLIAVIELAILAAVAVGWVAAEGRPGVRTAWLLLALASGAMGTQSALSIGSGVPGASTTYLTGSLTTLVQTLATEPHRFAAAAGNAGRLAALLCGAAIGALLLRFAPLWAAVFPAVLVGTAVVIAAALGRGRTGES